MAGTWKKLEISNVFLCKHGCKVGSMVVMTESAYMTDDAWVALTPHIVRGYHAMPFIVDNPQWWVLEILDGYGSHVN